MRSATMGLRLWGIDDDPFWPRAHGSPTPRTPGPAPGELEPPAGELEPKRRRLGMHAVRAADRQCLSVLLGPPDDGGKGTADPVENERARLLHGERERGVEDVGRREAVVEPAAFRAQRVGG